MPVRGGGFIQGDNTQHVPREGGLVIATELTGDPAGMAWPEPVLAAADDAAAFTGAHRPAASAGPDPGCQDQDGGPGGGTGLALADAG